MRSPRVALAGILLAEIVGGCNGSTTGSTGFGDNSSSGGTSSGDDGGGTTSGASSSGGSPGGYDATAGSSGSSSDGQTGFEADSPSDDASSSGGEGGWDGPTYPPQPPLMFSAIGKPVQISGQFLFTEGPVWDPVKSVLYFSDINASIVYRLTLPSTFDSFVTSSGNANGLALDPSGNLIAAGFVARDIWRLSGSTMQPVTSSYQNKKLNSPDDI